MKSIVQLATLIVLIALSVTGILPLAALLGLRAICNLAADAAAWTATT